ncbi:MAG: GIY-YIG nuclease family protein [Patescibacteria group bacterium]|jgi:putative endonuclease
MFTVYILQNTKTNRFYIGHTFNLVDRLRRHNRGRNISTKGDGQWILQHKEEFPTKQEAYKREMQIKSYKGGEAFKKLILS